MNNLKQLRTAAGLTQKQVADKAEMLPHQLCRLETGERNPEKMELRTAVKIAEALGVHTEELIK